jgi:hypothetical protein
MPTEWIRLIVNFESLRFEEIRAKIRYLLNTSPQFIDTIHLGRTVLHMCCNPIDSMNIPLLLSYGANPNITNKEGKTVLDRVVNCHCGTNIAYELCIHGAKFTSKLEINYGPINYLPLLVEFGFIGVNDEIGDKPKMIPIQYAMWYSNISVVRDLLNLGSKSSIYVRGLSAVEYAYPLNCLEFVIYPIRMVCYVMNGDADKINNVLVLMYNIYL